MGIRNFVARTVHLRSHGPLIEHDGLKSIAVIDGPNLVFWCYNKLRASIDAPPGSGPLPYDRIIEAVLAWLRDLSTYGFVLEAIIFDGGLPLAKKDTRLRRLGEILKIAQRDFKAMEKGNSQLLNYKAESETVKPTFLVPAVIEALRSTSFGRKTYLVPCEGDPVCVVAARHAICRGRGRAFIFSDDSDLLIYPHLEHIRVVMFKGLGKYDPPGVSNNLSGYHYHPYGISQSKNLEPRHLIKPAYIMSRDENCTFDNALRMAGVQDLDSDPGYQSFLSTYDLKHAWEVWKDMSRINGMQDRYSSRDPRISELICQLGPTGDGQDKCLEKCMYLPLSYENANKSGAWEQSSYIRDLAYSVIIQGTDACEPVQEYLQRGHQIGSRRAALIEPWWMPKELSKFMDTLDQCLQAVGQDASLDNTDAWRFGVMKLVIDRSKCERSWLPSFGQLKGVLTLPWGQLKGEGWHLWAECEATYYSVRMLKQGLEFRATKDPAASGETEELVALHAMLRSLPPIAWFFPPGSLDESKKWDSHIEELLRGGEEGEKEEEEGEEMEMCSEEEEGGAEPAEWLGENKFSLLASRGME